MGAAFCSQMFAVAPYTHCKHQFATGLLGPSWARQTMDQAKDLEMETNPTENETFEELVTELGGFGKYQKRLLCLLAAFLFTTIPILQCHQVAKRLSRKIKTEICCHRCLSCTVQITHACQATSFQLTMR